MDRLFLVDAYALIYRSYYAFIKNPRVNSKGFNTSAIMGFFLTLHEVISKERPTHIGVAFDTHGPTFRSEAYPAYKAQREATPEDIHASVPIIKEILRAMNIPVIQVAGYEADDVIGTLATKAASIGLTTYMLTPDKDYGQLVGNNVFMYRPRHGGGYEVLDTEGVKSKYGISSPRQVIDLLGLMGDASDNIPGCPGVGEKTAVKLIGEFGSVESLLKRTGELKGALKKKVESNAEQIRFSKFLATIKTDVPVALDTDALRVKPYDEDKVRELFGELEFKTLADKFLNEDKTERKQASVQPDFFAVFPTESTEKPKEGPFLSAKTTPHEYKLVDNVDDMKRLCEFFLTGKYVSLDTETTSTDAVDAELVGLSFAVEECKAYYVPVPADREEAQKIVDIFRPLYENADVMKIGQNIKYDFEVLSNYGITLAGDMFDTMIAHYLIRPELRHNMDDMAETYLNYKTIHIDELIGAKGKNQKSMRDLTPEQVCEYAAEDADITLRLKNVFEPELKKLGLERLFREMEMPLVPVLASMEMQGVRIDTDSLKETSGILTARMHALEKRIYELAGQEFNISSPKQVGDILFGKMKIVEKPKKTKTGQYVTSEEVLQQLKGKNEIVGDILAHRGLKKLLGTYVDALPKLINPRTGRIHTSFNQTVTATGRLSSSDPNLQNIPVRGEDGKEIRRAFVPEPGCLFFSADYSQIELRVLAALSGDIEMISAYENGIDVHALTASQVFHTPLEDVTADMRRRAKAVNFGIVYGISAFGLGEDLDISRKEASEYIAMYFKSHPGVDEYLKRCVDEAKELGYTRTYFGRIRQVPELKSSNFMQRSFGERIAMNSPIQGTAADIMKIAMNRVNDALKGMRSRIVLQVHDELLIETAPEELETVKVIVKECMEGAADLGVRLEVNVESGLSWYECH